MQDPRRLLDDPETSDVLRSALGAASEDLPSEGELASLAAKLGPLLGPGGGGGGGGGDVSPIAGSGSGVAAKVFIGAIATAAAVGGAVWWGTTTEPAPRRRAPEPAHEVVELSQETEGPTEDVMPEGVDVPEDLEPQVRVTPAEAPVVQAFERDPEAELALLRSAQDALRGSPARALDLTAEHERRFGEGSLGQEREVVAIDALVQLGRRDEARARAERFSERWPRSAHRRRIDVLLGP